MNIVCATDNNFVQHCAVTIVSILKNNPSGVDIYLLTEGLSVENKKMLNKLATNNNGRLYIVIVNSEALKNCPMPQLSNLSHISIATYYRLLIPELLPPTIDRVIYLDCDIVVRHPLDDLWNYSISGYGLGAVYHISNWSIDAIKRLGYPVSYGYFNAGVLLIDLKYWREKNISEQLFVYLDQKKDVIVFHDQDALNGLMHAKCCRLPCKWNMLNGFFKKGVLKINDIHDGAVINNFMDYKSQIVIEKDDPTIIHFAFKPKPWEAGCTHPYKKEYYKYLQYTPWYNFKAPNAITAFLKNPRKQYIWLKQQVKRVILGNPYFQLKTICPEGEFKKEVETFLSSQ